MILLDTHVLIWLAGEPSNLSRKARDAIRRASQGTGIAIHSQVGGMEGIGKNKPAFTIRPNFWRRIDIDQMSKRGGRQVTKPAESNRYNTL
jgi:hypothetical protein